MALPNGIEFLEACLAAWKLGATPQPGARGDRGQGIHAIVDAPGGGPP